MTIQNEDEIKGEDHNVIWTVINETEKTNYGPNWSWSCLKSQCYNAMPNLAIFPVNPTKGNIKIEQPQATLMKEKAQMVEFKYVAGWVISKKG